MAIKRLTTRDLQVLFLKAQHLVVSRSLSTRGFVELEGARLSLSRHGEQFAGHPSRDTILVDSIWIMGGLNNRRKFLGKRAVEGGDFVYLNCYSHQACSRVLSALDRYWVLEELARV